MEHEKRLHAHECYLHRASQAETYPPMDGVYAASEVAKTALDGDSFVYAASVTVCIALVEACALAPVSDN